MTHSLPTSLDKFIAGQMSALGWLRRLAAEMPVTEINCIVPNGFTVVEILVVPVDFPGFLLMHINYEASILQDEITQSDYCRFNHDFRATLDSSYYRLQERRMMQFNYSN